jgi:branched-chain amino acid transport system substrate-binding protein
VIGVIGPLASICARVEVPIANRAPGGPLPIVSATNTYVGLTHAGPGTAPDEPARYYPTGTRNYVRVIAADDVQAAADALLARQAGLRRIYVVRDEPASGYGVGLADAFTSAARKLRLKVVGADTWDYANPRPRLLAERAHRLHASAVFIGAAAIDDPRIGSFIQGLHAFGIRIIAPDAFSEFGKLIRVAGAAAEGMTISVPGLPNSELPKPGKGFVAASGAQSDRRRCSSPSTRLRQPRSCSTRSHARTAPANPCARSCSTHGWRTDSSAPSPSTATETRRQAQ